METNAEIARDLLHQFLTAWDEQALAGLTLEQYVTVNNRNTFVQWVEHRTKPLGSISGRNSSKFGIWERKDPTRKVDRFTNVGKYSWPKGFGHTSAKDTFAAVKAELLFIIQAAKEGRFSAIDRPGTLTDFYKWKVAYLYSNERLISIFSRRALEAVAVGLGLKNVKKLPVSVIQQAMMDGKPYHMTIYQYSNHLFQTYAPPREKKAAAKGSGNRRNTRKATSEKNTATLERKAIEATIMTQEHNRLQNLLAARLRTEYGAGAVDLEHNFVDIKVTRPDGNLLYEVKSGPYAAICVEQALGQILRYALDHQQRQEDAVELIVAGKFPANKSDEAYIAFVASQIKIPFRYLMIE